MDHHKKNSVVPANITDELHITDKEIDEMEEQAHKPAKSLLLDRLKKNAVENILLIMTIIAVAVGVGLGFLFREVLTLNKAEIKYFGFPGEMFLRGLKFIILPLISSSLITGIAGLGVNKTGKVAARALILYFSTTAMAVILGLILVATIKPGTLTNNTPPPEETNLDAAKLNTADTFLDLFRNLVPDNMIEMGFLMYASEAKPEYKKINVTNLTTTDQGLLENVTTEIKVVDYYYASPSTRRGLNVLGLVLFCAAYGAVLASLGERGKPMVNFFEILNECSIKIIRFIMWFSPIGICSLICESILEMEDPEQTFASISFYMITVFVGLFIHGFIVLPLLLFIFTRRNVFVFMKNMLEAMLIALATASSAATLPITFRCIEEKNGIPRVISRFVLPVGATINLDGTALYEAVAAIFIAQLTGLELTFIDLVVCSITATLSSIGAAGIPSAGLVTIIIVLTALNIPADNVSLIYAVDWLLDRFRTMINVWGDSVVCGIVAHLSRKEIEEDAMRQQQAEAETGAGADSEVPKLNGNVTEAIEMETTDFKKRSAVNADDNNSNIDF